MSLALLEDPSFIFLVFRLAMGLFWLAVGLCHSAFAAIILANI